MDKTSSPAVHPVDWRDTVTWYTTETNFIRFIRFLGRPFFSALAQVDYQGWENIPPGGPCVLAANHLSNLDVGYMGAFLPRYPHFMAKRELYKNPMLGWLIRQLGSFPVNRGESDPWALRQAGRVLAAGQLLFMFPEGTRSRGQAQMRRGKVGAVKLALEYQATLVPAAIWGTEKFRFGRRRNNQVHIRVGRPLDLAAMAGPPPWPHDTYRDLTEQLMQEIAAMLPPGYRGVYG
ncbi:MAG: lysophospholipid acyltransferase family protein [Chloroflexota bacterium]